MNLEQTLNRIQANLKPPTPEQLETAKAERLERENNERTLRMMTLKGDWNAPLRHLKTEIRHDGQWQQTVDRLKAKLSTGFLAALAGQRGNGKTQLGVELMKLAVADLRPARYVTAVEFFMAVKATYKKDAKTSEADVIKEFRKPKLLVIDEASKRSESAWENLLIGELVDKRYQDMTDTLLIANQSPMEFTASIGPSLASRMGETGGIIECNWPSFR